MARAGPECSTRRIRTAPGASGGIACKPESLIISNIGSVIEAESTAGCWGARSLCAMRTAQSTRWFGTCTDIQDIIDAREVLARSREELEKEVQVRTVKLLEAEAQLRQAQKMEAVGQLTGGVAHDFNNMLAVILGAMNLLERRLARGETDLARYIDAAKDGANRAAALTQRLLAFSRRQPLQPEIIEPNRMVAGMRELLTRALGEQVQVETVLAAGL